MLWANLHLLFWLSLVPFATAWMGENHFAAAPAALYGVVLLMAALAYYILRADDHPAPEGPDSPLAKAIGNDLEGQDLAGPLPGRHRRGLPHVPIALRCYVAVALMWIIPDRRIERQLGMR